MNRLFPCWALLLTALCACNVAVSNQKQQEVRRSFDLDPGAGISLSNVSGDISIVPWNESRAEMVAVKSGPADQLDRVDISIEAGPSRLNIETKYPRMKNNKVSVSFDLKVPKNVSLDGIGSVSGSIGISGVEGSVDVHSVSGDVAISKCTPSGIKASAVSGDIQFDGKLNTAGSYELKSHSGSVTVRLPRDSNFELEASSFSGSVRSDFEIKGAELDGKKTLKGIVGSGGPRLQAGSFSDDVSIEYR